jgi:hypothetical protein
VVYARLRRAPTDRLHASMPAASRCARSPRCVARGACPSRNGMELNSQSIRQQFCTRRFAAL